MKKYDIYWADFAFEDTNEVKSRPVVIIENGTVVDIAKVTKHKPHYKYDLVLLDWEKEGLSTKSTIRLDKCMRVSQDHLQKYIGHLSDKDIQRIEAKLNKNSKESIGEAKKKKTKVRKPTNADVKANINSFNAMMGTGSFGESKRIDNCMLKMSRSDFNSAFTFEDEEEPDVSWLTKNYSVDINTTDHKATIRGTEEDIDRLCDDFHLEDFDYIERNCG